MAGTWLLQDGGQEGRRLRPPAGTRGVTAFKVEICLTSALFTTAHTTWGHLKTPCPPQSCPPWGSFMKCSQALHIPQLLPAPGGRQHGCWTSAPARVGSSGPALQPGEGEAGGLDPGSNLGGRLDMLPWGTGLEIRVPSTTPRCCRRPHRPPMSLQTPPSTHPHGGARVHTTSLPAGLSVTLSLECNRLRGAEGGAGGALPPTGVTPHLSTSLGRGSLGSMVGPCCAGGHLEQCSQAGWCLLWSLITKLKAERVMGLDCGVTCLRGQMTVTGPRLKCRSIPQAGQGSTVEVGRRANPCWSRMGAVCRLQGCKLLLPFLPAARPSPGVCPKRGLTTPPGGPGGTREGSACPAPSSTDRRWALPTAWARGPVLVTVSPEPKCGLLPSWGREPGLTV